MALAVAFTIEFCAASSKVGDGNPLRVVEAVKDSTGPAEVGESVGVGEGLLVGVSEGLIVDGTIVGVLVRSTVVGATEGESVGITDTGEIVGFSEGKIGGIIVGSLVGFKPPIVL